MSFGLFWGAASVALPLFARVSSFSPVSQRFSKDTFFAFLVIVSISLFGINEVSKGIKLFIASFLGLAFFNQYNFASISTLYQFVMLSCGAGLFLQAVNMRDKDSELIKKCLGLSCAIQVILVILSTTGIDFYREAVELIFNAKTVSKSGGAAHSIIMGQGSFKHPNTAGAFIVATMPFLMSSRLKWLIPFAFASLFVCGSAMPLVSIMVAPIIFSLYVVKGARIASLFVLLFFCISLLVVFNIDSGFFSSSGRLQSWSVVLDFLKSNFKLLGYGPGFVYDNYRLFSGTNEHFRQLHNEYLEVLVGYGIPGVVLLSLFIKKILERINIIQGEAGLAFFVIAANAFGFFNIHISSIALVLILSCAIILRGYNVEKLEP